MSDQKDDRKNIQPDKDLLKKYKHVRRIRLTKSLNALRERARLIEMELAEYTTTHFRVCIFGSARIKPDDDLYRLTEQLAYLLGSEGIDVLTGGGHGLMGAANAGLIRGREEFGTASKSIGISVDLNRFEPLNDHLDIKHHHKKFSSRLDDFMRLSSCVVATPGGIGTLLEIYYTWQLLQLGHLSERPLILINKKFWGGLIEWMKSSQLGLSLVSDKDFRFVHFADTPEAAMEIIGEEYKKFKLQKNQPAEVNPESLDEK